MKPVMDPHGAGYWYAEQGYPGSVDVLNALRTYRAAETAMRRRTRTDMNMNETDLLAIRYVMRAHKAGKSISPKDLSRMLDISTPSTTALIDRLEASGHLTRRPHPTDRRSIEIIPTANADAEVRETLGEMHKRMLDVTDSLTPEEARTITLYLQRMTWAVEQIDHPHIQASVPSRPKTRRPIKQAATVPLLRHAGDSRVDTLD